METKEFIMAVIIILLLITTIIFGVRSGTSSSQAEAAKAMSQVLVDNLHDDGYHQTIDACKGVSPGRYAELQSCLLAIKKIDDLSNFFRETRYQAPEEKNNYEGYIVIENYKGGKTYESANFSLYLNNEHISTGCATPGKIKPKYTCRMDFTEECRPGDNLEIKYGERRAHLKTC